MTQQDATQALLCAYYVGPDLALYRVPVPKMTGGRYGAHTGPDYGLRVLTEDIVEAADLGEEDATLP